MRKVIKRTALAVGGLVILLVGGDVPRFNVAQTAASPYLFDLVTWEAANVFDKWLHNAWLALPWNSTSDQERLASVREYFRLGEEVAGIRSEMDSAAAAADRGAVSELEARLDALRARRSALRAEVEHAMEAALTAAAKAEGLDSVGGILLPPVDIRLSQPPKLLVTSPRGRISRTHDVLLRPDISIHESEQVERTLLEEADLSALVTDIGGIATYPASVPGTRTLKWTLELSAHEWVHHYLFFRPLGQRYSSDPDMQTLNETVADIAGRELGAVALELMGEPIDSGPSSEDNGNEATGTGPEFDFNSAMRETRLRVEALLSEGRVEDAEAYMEQRRLLFVDNGYSIRKLNQAYFAFHGTYADTAASISPIGDQLKEFRELTPDLGSFIRDLSGITSYERFLEVLESARGRVELR